jgi:hypothetical protein
MATSTPPESNATAAKRLEASMGVHTSDGTVHSALHESGLMAVKKTIVPYLYDTLIVQRDGLEAYQREVAPFQTDHEA